jgi:spermidine/putrescine transport system substrate-binding protein
VKVSRSTMSRRAFLGGGAAVVGGLAVGTTLVTRQVGSSPRVRVANWPYYIDDESLALFTRATGTQVDYAEDIDDNAAYFASIEEPLKNGVDFGRDLVVLTDWMAAKFIFSGYAARLHRLDLPNKVNIVDELAGVSFDPNRSYSLPWLSGMTGIAYDSAKVKDLTSVDKLLDPALSGRVGVLSESRDTIGLTLLSLGHDPARCSPAEITQAFEKLEAAKKKTALKIVGADYVDQLASGELVACMAWAGDLVDLTATRPSIRFVVPDDGGVFYTDNMLIPKTSPNQELAEQWMNWFYDPTNAGRLAAGTSFISPVKGAVDALRQTAPELADNELVNPSKSMRDRLSTFRYLDERSTAALDEQWAAFSA